MVASNEANPVRMIYSAQKEARLATERARYLYPNDQSYPFGPTYRCRDGWACALISNGRVSDFR